MLSRRKKHLQKTSNQKGVGGRGEDLAATFLLSKGYAVIARNWKNQRGRRIGEIDLICRDKDILVFVEVKSRTADNDLIRPEEQISRSKLTKLTRIAEHYIRERDLWDASYRFDAVSIVFVRGDTRPTIHHIKNIYL